MNNRQRPFWFWFELNRFSQMSGQPEKLQYITQDLNSAKSRFLISDFIHYLQSPAKSGNRKLSVSDNDCAGDKN
jgi:hypothetical protein